MTTARSRLTHSHSHAQSPPKAPRRHRSVSSSLACVICAACRRRGPHAGVTWCNAMQSSEIIPRWRPSVIGSCPACSTPQVRRTSNQVHTGPRQRTVQARAQPYGRWMVQRASAGTPSPRARLIRVALARVDSPGPRVGLLLLSLLQLRLCERGQSAPRQGQQSSASGGYSPELAVAWAAQRRPAPPSCAETSPAREHQAAGT
jgi:hypothetical protein